jgi:cell division ATPase FtsA
MNQVVTGMFLRERTTASRGVTESSIRPIAAAAAAIERCLAQAHEIGDTEAVRLLHAVSALLAASPKT